MRSLATFCLAVLMIASLSPALASESETIKAINESSNALDKAFEKNDQGADDTGPYLGHAILR